MDNTIRRRPGRPRQADGASSSTQNSRRYRQQVREDGGTMLSTALSPEATEALQRITEALERFGDLRGGKRHGTELALLLFDELLLGPSQQELLEVIAAPSSKPAEKITSLLLALGVQHLRNEMPA